MKIEEVPLETLVPNDKNPRKITRAEMNKLKRSIREFGFVDPIIVNNHQGRENYVIGGHQRAEAAKQLGLKTVPVVYVDLPAERESLLNIALNEISGDWDEVKLAAMLKEIEQAEIDITLSGFDEPFIDELLGRELPSKESLLDVIPLKPTNPVSRAGDVWILGRHRLAVGDSTKEETWKKLMKDETGVEMCFTDPPYGVSYKGTNNPNGKPWGVMNNDELRGDGLFKFLKDAYSNAGKYLADKCALYTCYASINHIIFEKALNDAGFQIKQQLIWEKGHVLGHSDYHWSHEPILYCTKIGFNCEWLGDRTHKTFIKSPEKDILALSKDEAIQRLLEIKEASDLMSIKKDNVQEYLHSTQKPVDLSMRCIKNNTRPGARVLEPFAGSGSTLMACEASQRTCYAIELSERYADVIIERWHKYTGKDPVREGDGKKWSELQKSQKEKNKSTESKE